MCVCVCETCNFIIRVYRLQMMTHLTLNFDNLVGPLSSSVSPHSLRMSQDLDHHSSQQLSPDQSVVVLVTSLVSHMTRQRES